MLAAGVSLLPPSTSSAATPTATTQRSEVVETARHASASVGAPSSPKQAIAILPQHAASPSPVAGASLPRACRLTTLATAPPTVRGLCNVTSPNVQAQLVLFFSSSTPKLRVFIEDADVRPLVGGPCEKLFFRAFNKREAHDNPYAAKFAAELLIPAALAESPYVTTDRTTANFFLAASCIMGQGQQGQHTAVATRLVRERYADLWERHGGRDHAFILTADHGPCLLYRERMGSQNDFFRYKRKRWQEESLRQSTLLMNEGSLHGGCYDPRKDLIVPTAVVHAAEPLVCPGVGGAVRNEADELPRHLAFLGGLSSSTLRQHIIDTYAGDSDFFTPEGRVEHTAYLCHMAESAFCLCPRGQASWSPRLEESIYAGCVPVIIADDYEPPLAHVLDYSTFSLRVLQDDVPNLKAILQRVTPAQLAALRRNVRAVRPAFRYLGYIAKSEYDAESSEENGSNADAVARAAHENDVTPLLAFELWRLIEGNRNVSTRQIFGPRDEGGPQVLIPATLAPKADEQA